MGASDEVAEPVSVVVKDRVANEHGEDRHHGDHENAVGVGKTVVQDELVVHPDEVGQRVEQEQQLEVVRVGCRWVEDGRDEHPQEQEGGQGKQATACDGAGVLRRAAACASAG